MSHLTDRSLHTHSRHSCIRLKYGRTYEDSGGCRQYEYAVLTLTSHNDLLWLNTTAITSRMSKKGVRGERRGQSTRYLFSCSILNRDTDIFAKKGQRITIMESAVDNRLRVRY